MSEQVSTINIPHPHFSRVFGDEFAVFCGWGEGPDVGINLTLRRPCKKDEHVFMDFTADQAETLGKALIERAADSRRWDAELNAYFDYEERNPIRLWTSAIPYETGDF